MATPQCSLPMTGIRDEEASYHRSTIAVLQPRYQATPILQQSVGGDRSGGLHFSSLLGAKPTSVETPKMTFLTPSVIPPPSIAALRKDYSITSSASACILSGTVRPRALAVFRFTMRSNLVGCSTGISPGFVPRKILSTKSAARWNRAG